MSVKKLLVLSAAAFVAVGTTAVMAGASDDMAMPSELAAFQNSIYLEGHGGYAQSNWNNDATSGVMGVTARSLFTPTSHGKGHVTAGVDLGYNVTQHIAFEGGWFYLPKVSGNGTGTTIGAISTITSAQTATIKSWLAYLMAKLSVPVMDHFDLFGKIGLGYRALDFSYGGPTVAGITTLNSYGIHGHYWTPVFAAGLQYDWNNWLFGAQYLYLPGNDRVNRANTAFTVPNGAPEANLYTAFAGYKFNV